MSLYGLNTFGLDVRARYLVRATEVEDLRQLFAQWKDVPKLVLGGGSNILFTKDFDGMVIKMEIAGISKVSEDAQSVVLEAGAGEQWHGFVRRSIELGLQGLENLSLIPGTVGASPIQNIGAYGVEVKDVIEEVHALDIQSGEMRVFSNAECTFGYRNSFFKQEGKGKYVVTHVRFRLRKHPEYNTSYGAIEETLRQEGISAPTARDISDAVIRIRTEKLPDPAQIGNCGSFFKNPEIPLAQYEALKAHHPQAPGYKTTEGMKVPAGWLIEQCGWKGKQVGHVGTYAKQALVLVNMGGATGAEAWQLALDIQASVQERFGIRIEPEVNIL